MGLLTEASRGLRAALPLPMGRGKTYVGWGGDSYGGSSSYRLPDEQDYSKKVGDGSGTSLITAAINWMTRELIPARPVLLEYPKDDAGVPLTHRSHPAVDLLRRPTPYYDGKTMIGAVAASYLVDGNGYRLKIRSQEGRVVQRVYLPHWCMEPVGRGSTFIEFYRYKVGGYTREFAPSEIDHLRFGLDPENPRKGMSPIRGVIRELYTDEQAARFSAALLHNLAFPGAVVIPGKDVEIAEKGDREEIRDTFDNRFRGDGGGRTVVLSANAEIKFLQWTPQELDLSGMRDVPEERVSAALGIPAAVLGFGTGLQQVKVGATMRELRSMGWEGAIIPFLEALAENDTAQLLPDFIGARDLPRFEFSWDLSRIAALSEIRLKQAQVEGELVGRKIKMVDEARLALGLPPVGGKDGGFAASPGVGGAPGGDDDPVRPMRVRAGDEAEDDDAGDEEGLTGREREVALGAGRGLANKQIASVLSLSERTVERHLANAKGKLGLNSRAELGAWASAKV